MGFIYFYKKKTQKKELKKIVILISKINREYLCLYKTKKKGRL